MPRNRRRESFWKQIPKCFRFNRPNDLKLFDKAFYGSDLILSGEMHGTANSYRVQKLLVNKLKEKANFKYYLIELDYVTGLKINKYLETGDEALLKTQFDQMKGSFVYSREYYDVFTHVYKINQTLKEKDRINSSASTNFLRARPPCVTWNQSSRTLNMRAARCR